MVRGDGDGAIIVGRIAGSHVDRVEGRAAGQRFADDRQFEHRLAARIAADEAEQAAVGAGEVGVDGDRQHRLNLALRSEEHTSELQSLMRISYAVFCLKKKKKENNTMHL